MVTDIFLDWESYPFRTEEIDAVFHGVVWPQVNLDFHILPRYHLLFPLLLLYLHSLHPGMNAYPGLFCHVKLFFVSGSFRTLFFASTTTKSSRASFCGIAAFILKANLNMTVSLKQMQYNFYSTSHGMPLGFDKHEKKHTGIFVACFLV